MSKIHSKYSHFILYGAQNNDVAQEYYKEILFKISKNNFHNLTVGYLTQENFQQNINNFNKNCFLFPLFLSNGFEYNKFISQYQHLFPQSSKIAGPLSSYHKILDSIFKDNDSKCFLMHGSKKYDNLKQYADIINFDKTNTKYNFCFLEGAPHYQSTFQSIIQSNQFLNIIPLFIFTGNHLKNEVTTFLVDNFKENQWKLQPSLLEREEIRDAIALIAINELTKR